MKTSVVVHDWSARERHEERILNLKELKAMIAEEEYRMQNCSLLSFPPSSLLQVLTHRVTSLTEEQFPASSLLADSGEELASERLISGRTTCLRECPSTVWGRQRLGVSSEGISLLERKVVGQIGLFIFVCLLSFKYMDTKNFL